LLLCRPLSPENVELELYTKDLADSLNLLNPDCPVEIIAMDTAEGGTILPYPGEVSTVIRQNDGKITSKLQRILIVVVLI
jgi:hypothetical protein